MQVEVARADLARAMRTVSRFVENRNTIPILAHVRLEADGERLTITATDLDIEAKISIPAKGEPGSTTASAKLLAGIAKDASGDTVTLTSGDRLTVAAGRSRYQLATLPVSDFPEFSVKKFSHSFEADLGALFAPVQFSISTEETRYYLCGIYLHLVDDALRAVSTDGHRLARNDIRVPSGAAGLPGIIIPRKTVGLVPTGTVKVSASQTSIRFVSGDITITSKLIDGSYPDYARVIPGNADRTATLEREALIAAVSRVNLVSSDRGRAVKFTFSGNELRLSVRSDDAEATESMPCPLKGDPIEIGFNARYVLDVLGVLTGDEIEIAMVDPGSPTLLRSPGTNNFLSVLMPMRTPA